MKVIVIERVAQGAGSREPAGWRVRADSLERIEADRTPYAFTPLLRRLAALAPDAVAFRGAALAPEALLASWAGHRTAWIRPALRDAAPPDLVRELAEAQADLVLDADTSAGDVGARVATALAGRRRAEPSGLPPAALSSWLRLQDQLALRFSLADGDGMRQAALVRETCRIEAAGLGGDGRSADGAPTLLLLTHEFSWSGAPLALFRVASGLVEARPSWRVRVLGPSDGPLREEYRRIGIEAGLYDPADLAGFLDRVDALGPSVVLVNSATLYDEVLLLEWKGLPVAWWVHEGINHERREGHVFEDRAMGDMVGAALAAADEVIFSCEDTRREHEDFCGTIVGRTAVVPNPMFLDELESARASHGPAERREVRAGLGVGEDDFVFLCVGAIETRKNHKRLVDAFQRMRASVAGRGRRSRLVLLGRALREPGSENLLEELEAAIDPACRDAVVIAGNRPSILPVILSADCHVLVSTTESSPLVNLEAAALGIPCVSSAVHGIPEVIADGERGFLADPRDAGDIAAALGRVVRRADEDPAGLAAIAQSAREWVRSRHGHRDAARLVGAALDRVVARDRGSRLGGAAANRLFAEQLIAFWSIAKRDAPVERHLARAHAHRAFGREDRLSVRAASPARAAVRDDGAPRFVVTGGCGMIGSALVRKLLGAGARVLVVDDLSLGRREALPSSPRVDLVAADLADPGALDAIVSSRPRAVFHLAALSTVPACEEFRDRGVSTNVDGTRALLAALSRDPPPCFVFASSGAVYAPSSRPHREDDPLEPEDAYGRTKLLGEGLVRSYAAATGARTRIARLFNAYGPRWANPNLVPRILEQIAAGSGTITLGNLDTVRDFSFVEDVAEALVRLARLDTPGCVTANVGTGRGSSARDLVAALARLLGRRLELRSDPALMRPTDRPFLLGDASRLRSLCGWSPKFDVESGLSRTLAGLGPRVGRGPL